MAQIKASVWANMFFSIILLIWLSCNTVACPNPQEWAIVTLTLVWENCINPDQTLTHTTDLQSQFLPFSWEPSVSGQPLDNDFRNPLVKRGSTFIFPVWRRTNESVNEADCISLLLCALCAESTGAHVRSGDNKQRGLTWQATHYNVLCQNLLMTSKWSFWVRRTMTIEEIDNLKLRFMGLEKFMIKLPVRTSRDGETHVWFTLHPPKTNVCIVWHILNWRKHLRKENITLKLLSKTICI